MVLKNKKKKETSRLSSKVSQEYRLVQQATSFALEETDEDPMRHQVILDYLPLIRYIAQKLATKLPSNVDLDDLYSAGVIGLMDAINKYDPTRDNKFKTYAEFRIRGSMLDELRSQDWVPRSVREYKKKEDRVKAALETELGRPAIQQEIAKGMELSMDEYHSRSGRAHVSLVSLDDLGFQNHGDRDKMSLMECVPHPLKAVLIKNLLSKIFKKLL
jgi:RNA polymerase sigma factor for flagellar operon FliA